MSDTYPKYKWLLSSTACSSCQGMAVTEYTTKPKRPHPNCQCTIVTITGNNYGGMTDMLPRIVSVEVVGGHTEYDEGSNGSTEKMKERGRENFSARGEFNCNVTVRCPKNNEIILDIVVVVEDGELYDVIMNWASPSMSNESGHWEEPKDDFEQEIEDAIRNYMGGLETKALQQARSILASDGDSLCGK